MTKKQELLEFIDNMTGTLETVDRSTETNTKITTVYNASKPTVIDAIENFSDELVGKRHENDIEVQIMSWTER